MPVYSPRIVDGELRELLESAGAVVIEGPKACGKTMTASQQSASRVLLDIDQAARQALAMEPRLVLEGARPRLLARAAGQTSESGEPGRPQLPRVGAAG